jgi:hypothetical protein
MHDLFATLREWFYHKFDPHCPECEAKDECPTCEALKYQLEAANRQNEALTQAIVSLTKPAEPDVRLDSTGIQPILPRVKNWSKRRQEIEANDRAAAQTLAQHRKEAENAKPPTTEEVAELERDLGIAEDIREHVRAGV